MQGFGPVSERVKGGGPAQGRRPGRPGNAKRCSQATGSDVGCKSSVVLETASRENQQWSSGKIAQVWQQMRAARRGKTAPGGPAIGDDGRRIRGSGNRALGAKGNDVR